MKSLLTIISTAFIKIKFKKSKKTHNLFNKFISSSKKIIILVDESVTDKSLLIELIKYFLGNEKHLTLLLPSNMMSLLSDFSKIELITFNPIDINFLGFPKKNILEKLDKKSFDVLLDLSIKENFFNIYINKFLEVNFSVGFKKPRADAYYNFQIKPETISENSYRNLLNSLIMF